MNLYSSKISSKHDLECSNEGDVVQVFAECKGEAGDLDSAQNVLRNEETNVLGQIDRDSTQVRRWDTVSSVFQ